METYIVKYAFGIERRVYSQLMNMSFDIGDEVTLSNTTNLPDSRDYWVIEKNGEEVGSDYGHIISHEELANFEVGYEELLSEKEDANWFGVDVSLQHSMDYNWIARPDGDQIQLFIRMGDNRWGFAWIDNDAAENMRYYDFISWEKAFHEMHSDSFPLDLREVIHMLSEYPVDVCGEGGPYLTDIELLRLL